MATEQTQKMITVTAKAAEKIHEFMKEEAESPEYLRVYVQGGGCSGLSYGMGFEKAPEDDDIVMEENGVKLLVDSYSVDHLQGANVDYIESLMGSGFKINNPNVTKSCSLALNKQQHYFSFLDYFTAFAVMDKFLKNFIFFRLFLRYPHIS